MTTIDTFLWRSCVSVPYATDPTVGGPLGVDLRPECATIVDAAIFASEFGPAPLTAERAVLEHDEEVLGDIAGYIEPDYDPDTDDTDYRPWGVD